jgi:lipopolysaccharide transport system permease protein
MRSTSSEKQWDLPGSGWTVRRATRGLDLTYIRRLVEWRELLFFVAWRDLKVKHKQMALGLAWTVIQPLTQAIVFSLVLGRFARLPTENGLPYFVLVFSALVPWQYFAASVNRAAASLTMSEALLTKAAFPRLILPTAAMLPGMIDIAAGLTLLAGLMIWFAIAPAPTIFLLPLFLLFALVSALAVGLWLSALTARYRDVSYLLPFVLQVWMLITPVGYSVTIVPEGWRTVYELNPLAVVVRGFRWALFGTAPLQPIHALSVVVVLIILLGGVLYFRQVERTLADVI